MMTTQPPRTLPKAILFDHDGVLVASEPLHWAAWEKLLLELDIPYNSSEMRTFIGRTAPEIIVELLNLYRPGWDPAKYNPTQLAKRKNDFYLASARTDLRAYPGVIEGLEWVRAQGIRLAVVSNAKRRELEMALALLGITSAFDAIVSRDEVSSPKPDPAPYLFAAAILGVAPADCIAVEDSPPGLIAALRAGIPAAAVETNFPRAQLEHPAPDQPELKPEWIGHATRDFFAWLKQLPPQG
jgi:HAD superfamily hydrolase (TIGR01509 family)